MASQFEINLLRDEIARREAEVAAWERLIAENHRFIEHVRRLRHDLAPAEPVAYWWAEENVRA